MERTPADPSAGGGRAEHELAQSRLGCAVVVALAAAVVAVAAAAGAIQQWCCSPEPAPEPEPRSDNIAIVDFSSSSTGEFIRPLPGIPFVVFEAEDAPDLLIVMGTRSRAGLEYWSPEDFAGDSGAFIGDEPGVFYGGWAGLPTIKALAAHVAVTDKDGEARLELAHGYYAVCLTSNWSFWVSRLRVCLNTDIAGDAAFGAPSGNSLCYWARQDDDGATICSELAYHLSYQ